MGNVGRLRKLKHAELEDKDWLHDLYVVQRKTAKAIAGLLGCSTWSVYNALSRHGIDVRSTAEAITGKIRYSKYPLLNDEQWLRQKYEVEKLPVLEIARLAGAKAFESVQQSIRRFGITERPLVRHIKAGTSLKYPKLNDKDWLREKYQDEKLSLNEVGKLCGANCSAVRQALIRHDIPVRTKSEGHIAKNGDDGFVMDYEVVTGALLGDGGLRSDHPESEGACPYFHKGNVNYDHVEFVAKILFPNTWQERIFDCKNAGGFAGGSGRIFRIRSFSRPDLIPFYREWYPSENNYKKIVPSTIPMTSKVLLHWFLDDGYSYYVNRKYPTYSRTTTRIQFSTQSFTKEEIEMLGEKCKQAFGLKLRPRYHQKHGKVAGTGYFAEVSEAQKGLFYEIIGPPPVQSLAYKWK